MQIQKIIIPLFIGLILNFSIQAQCLSDKYSTNEKDAWLSCQSSTIPNSSTTDNYHWIYYDLGYDYPIGTVNIWNYNVADATEKGIKDGEIFYSSDGQRWISGGVFQIPEANGQVNYSGWEGIDLDGVVTRYITIVAYSNWGNGVCTGLSQVRFNIDGPITALREESIVSSKVVVFPNPTNQFVSLSLTDNQPIKELIVMDNAGHEILRKKNHTSNHTIDVAAFPAGMYYVKIWTANQEYLVHKFIKTDF